MLRRWFSFIAILTLMGGTVCINNYFTPQQQQLPADQASVSEVKRPTFLYGMVVDDYTVIKDKIKRNERLGDILQMYNVPVKFINQLSKLSHTIFDVRKIAPDKRYTLICTTDSVKTAKALVYEPNPIDYVVLKFEDSLQIDVCKREVVRVERSISGVINTTLSHAIEELGISADLTNKFVDIFAHRNIGYCTQKAWVSKSIKCLQALDRFSKPICSFNTC